MFFNAFVKKSAIRYITSHWSVDPKDKIRFIRSIRVQNTHPHGKIRVYPCPSVCQKYSLYSSYSCSKKHHPHGKSVSICYLWEITLFRVR